MEASSAQQQKEKEQLVYRPYAFEKMEGLVREMQDPENGVPVRSQKQFLTSIPSAFMGYDLIEWLMERLGIEESVEAVHIANQLCQYGYFFPVNDSKTLTVKDDSSLYRFQTPYYWPRQHKSPDNVEYAIYLAKRTLRNKQRHALEDYEIEALNSLRKNLQNKWDIIQLQAEEQVRLSKERKKGDKIVSDSQERAFWRVYRPPPGCLSSLEAVPVPTRARPGLPRAPPRKRTITDLQREVDLLRNSLTRTRIKVSAAIENLKSYFETYMEYDPMIVQPQPSNPWITDDQTFWQLNSPLVEVPTEKRVKRWAISMEELMSDPTGLQEFTNYLRKEYSHENIRFWLAVKDLRHSTQAQIPSKVNDIFREFLAPGAPCEINIDGKTMEKVHNELKNVSRFTFDAAAEHVYTLLLKKDCYPRFIRSDHYRNLLAAGVQPLQKKRFFGFGGQGKKKVSTTSVPMSGSLQQQHGNISSSSGGGGGRRRGSDRSLSGSAHELAICGVRDVTTIPHVPHSHSQSNLTDIPYRGDLARFVKIPSRPNPRSIQDVGAAEATARPMDDVCPWDTVAGPDSEAVPDVAVPTSSGATASAAEVSPWDMSASQSQSFEIRSSRKNSTQLDSCSSSSDISIAIAEVSERLRKSCGTQQQQPQQQPQQQQTTSVMDRGAMSRNFSVGSMSGRVKLSDTCRASVSSFNYPSPQHSFDLSYIVGEKPEPISRVKSVPEETEVQEPRKREKYRKDDQPTSLVVRGKAPLISISAIVGDLPEDVPEQEEVCRKEEHSETIPESMAQSELEAEKPDKDGGDDDAAEKDDEGDKASGDKGGGGDGGGSDGGVDDGDEDGNVPVAVSAVCVEPNAEEGAEEAQVVPVWEPDAQQDEGAAAAAPNQEQRDNNVNEVCPWEDEENCRVDAPYVKTYATLGYL